MSDFKNKNDQASDAIAPGDMVKWTKQPGYSWMTVEAIEDDKAICTYRVLDKPLDGPERPTALVPQQGCFPLAELEVQRGH